MIFAQLLAVLFATTEFFVPSEAVSNAFYVVKGDYYKAFITSVDDIVGIATTAYTSRTYRLSRTFELTEQPTEAHFFAYCEDDVEYALNGVRLPVSGGSWRGLSVQLPAAESSAICAAARLGTNTLEAVYTTDRISAGGICGELFFRFGAPTEHRFLRIPTDASWSGAREWPPPPAPPYHRRLRYRDYDNMATRTYGEKITRLSVVAGETARLTYDLVNSRPPTGVIQLDLALLPVAPEHGPVPHWEERLELDAAQVVTPLPTGGWRLAFDWRAPLYFNSGDFIVKIESNAITMNDLTPLTNAISIVRAPLEALPGHGLLPMPPDARVKNVNGRPTVFVNGEPLPVLWGGLYSTSRPEKSPYHGPMPLTVTTLYPPFFSWRPSMTAWDFARFDREAEAHRRVDKDAYFVFDISVYTPPDFGRYYPRELLTDETGSHDCWGLQKYSYAGDHARAEITNQIIQAIRYIESAPYANRVLGYRINSGDTLEWLGSCPEKGHIHDFAPPAIRAYHEYVAHHYPDLETPHVPSAEERQALDSPNDILWNKSNPDHQNVMAYYDFVSWIVQRNAIEACRAARETLSALGRRKLVGCYFGYSHYLNHNGHDHRRAHYRFRDFLSACGGLVDFLIAPYGYELRSPGEFCSDMRPLATLWAHGILPVMEDDSRTHARPLGGSLAYQATHSRRQTAEIVRRNMAVTLCRLGAPYQFALCCGTEFDFPEAAQIGAEILRALESANRRQISRHAEVALVSSERSIIELPELYRSARTGGTRRIEDRLSGEPQIIQDRIAVYNDTIFGRIQQTFAQSGLPTDLLLAEDLPNFAGDYKLYVFLNCLDYDEQLLATIRRLRARGAVCLWLYAPGWMKSNSLTDMTELTTLKFTELGEGPAEGMPDAIVARRFRAEAETATDRFYPGWQMSPTQVRRYAAEAGAHIWCPTEDLIEANDGFVMMHTTTAGLKTINLPAPRTVIDAYTGETMATDATTFTFTAPAFATRLFELK